MGSLSIHFSAHCRRVCVNHLNSFVGFTLFWKQVPSSARSSCFRSPLRLNKAQNSLPPTLYTEPCLRCNGAGTAPHQQSDWFILHSVCCCKESLVRSYY